jgi:hypothetical protein
MSEKRLQATGGYSSDDGYSVSICFGEGPLMTLEFMTKEEVIYLRDLFDCLLFTDSEDSSH